MPFPSAVPHGRCYACYIMGVRVFVDRVYAYPFELRGVECGTLQGPRRMAEAQKGRIAPVTKSGTHPIFCKILTIRTPIFPVCGPKCQTVPLAIRKNAPISGKPGYRGIAYRNYSPKGRNCNRKGRNWQCNLESCILTKPCPGPADGRKGLPNHVAAGAGI